MTVMYETASGSTNGTIGVTSTSRTPFILRRSYTRAFYGGVPSTLTTFPST